MEQMKIVIKRCLCQLSGCQSRIDMEWMNIACMSAGGAGSLDLPGWQMHLSLDLGCHSAASFA